MGIDFSKFTSSFKTLWNEATKDNIVTLEEQSKFDAKDRSIFFKMLEESPEAFQNIKIEYVTAQKNNDTSKQTLTMYSGNKANEGRLDLKEKTLKLYPNAAFGYLKNGIVTLYDKSGHIIKDEQGNYARFNMKDENSGIANWYMKHTQNFDLETLTAMQNLDQKINQAEDVDEDYSALMQGIKIEELKNASEDEKQYFFNKMEAKVESKREQARMAFKQATEMLYEAHENGTLSEKGETFYNALMSYAQVLDGDIGITRFKEVMKEMSGVNWAADFMADAIDDGDDNNLSFGEKAVELVKGGGRAIDNFIGTQGLAFILALGVATEASTVVGAGEAFSMMTQAYFLYEGANLTAEGIRDAISATTKEEANEAGEKIGTGTIMLAGTGKSIKKAGKNQTNEKLNREALENKNGTIESKTENTAKNNAPSAKAELPLETSTVKGKEPYVKPKIEIKSLELQDDIMAETSSKTNANKFKVERIGTSQNKCGVLELQNSNGEQVGVANYDLREINGQKVLHFEGLKSNISGAGVGSKLIQELVKLSNELGAEGRVVATASPMMSPDGKLTNMGFYYKLGFKATDATKDAEIRKLLGEGKEIPVSLNVFTDIELTPDGIVKNTLSSKEAKKLEPMQKQYPEIVNSIIQEYAGKLTNEEIIEKAGNAISEKINEALPHAQVTNYTPKVEIEMPINETRFDNGNKTLDVNLPDGVSEGVPMPTKIKAELGTTSIHLANEYKEALTACVEQAKNTVGENKLSTVKNVSTRSKGAASIEPKLEKGLRKKGHLDYNAAKECIGDAVGARIITKNLRKLSDKEITDRINNMKVDNKPLTAEQKELLKKYIYEEKFDSDAKKLEGFYLFEQFTRPLVKERTSEVVNELLLSMAKFLMIDRGLSIEQIERTGLLSDNALIERLKTDDSIEPLEVLQVNNYTGIYGLPEFTVDQTFAIQKLLSLNDKKGIVYTRADIGKDLYTNTGYTSPEEVLRAQNGDELPKSIKSSGYRTAQMNVVFKNGTLGEIQFRGEETNKIGEYEHIAYDLRQGKNTLGSLFNDFKDAISKLSPEEYSEYNNYLEACYNYYNRIELGLPANKPKLPSKFNPILSEENMKELHDKNEARLNDLKKNFKEGKIR